MYICHGRSPGPTQDFCCPRQALPPPYLLMWQPLSSHPLVWKKTKSGMQRKCGGECLAHQSPLLPPSAFALFLSSPASLQYCLRRPPQAASWMGQPWKREPLLSNHGWRLPVILFGCVCTYHQVLHGIHFQQCSLKGAAQEVQPALQCAIKRLLPLTALAI